MASLVGPDGLESRLGRTLLGPELGRAEAVLDDASELVREVGSAAWTDTTVPGAVRAVVLKVAERAVRNPMGFSSETAGDYSYQRGGVQDGVYLTDQEVRLVRRAAGRVGLWTQPVTRGDLPAVAAVFVEDSFGCELFPVDTYLDQGG